MPTLRELIDSARHQLSGYDSTKDAVAGLTLAVSDSDTTLKVAPISSASVGTLEVELEKMRVESVDLSNGTVNVFAGFGRGYRTPASAHAVNSEVTFNPAWPASTVAREINGVLSEVYPHVYGVAEYTGTISDDWGQAVPAAAVGVIGVYVQDPVTDDWLPVYDWSWGKHASTDNTGLTLPRRYRIGDSYRVVYAKRPVQFDLAGDLDQDFATVTGLEDRLADLVLLGVAKRMAPFVDVSRLPYATTALREQGDARPANAGSSITRLLAAVFQDRLQAEALVLAKEHPIKRNRAVR